MPPAFAMRRRHFVAVFPDFTEHVQVGALKLLLASDRMLIPGRKACRYREQP